MGEKGTFSRQEDIDLFWSYDDVYDAIPQGFKTKTKKANKSIPAKEKKKQTPAPKKKRPRTYDESGALVQDWSDQQSSENEELQGTGIKP